MTPFCYICGSILFIDEHHLDCKRGRISGETVPLCRRCHRTYHDWGLGAFSPDTTDKALEVENKRCQILGLRPMQKAEITRSSYWRKKWGIPSHRKVKQDIASPQLPLFEIDPRTGSRVKRDRALATSRGTECRALRDSELRSPLADRVGRG